MKDEEVRVDVVLLGGAHAMCATLVDLQGRPLDQFRAQHGRVPDRHDLIVIAVQNQGWLVDSLQVLGLISLRKGLDAEIACRHAGHHALKPERLAHALGNLRARSVVAIEGHGQVLEKLGAVIQHTLADAIEHIDRQTTGICRRLQHQRWNGADQNRLRYSFCAVATDVTGNFAAAGGVADVDHVAEVELLHKLCEVVGIGVHVVAVPGLTGTAVSATIMRDAAISLRSQKEHLVLEGVGAQRPAVTEHHRLTRAPILVVDLGSVFGDEGTPGFAPRSLTVGRDGGRRSQRQRGDACA
jgi:hypothetical protein